MSSFLLLPIYLQSLPSAGTILCPPSLRFIPAALMPFSGLHPVQSMQPCPGRSISAKSRTAQSMQQRVFLLYSSKGQQLMPSPISGKQPQRSR